VPLPPVGVELRLRLLPEHIAVGVAVAVITGSVYNETEVVVPTEAEVHPLLSVTETLYTPTPVTDMPGLVVFREEALKPPGPVQV